MTPVQVAVSGEGNRVYGQAGSAEARLEVFSERGLGGAEVIFPADEWPAAITLRLHLRGLESLRFRFDEYTVSVSVSSSEGYTLTEELSEARAPRATPVEPGSLHWMAVTRTPMAEGPTALRFDVAAPAALFAGGPRPFSFDWLDFYR
jgi:hypothetical protein